MNDGQTICADCADAMRRMDDESVDLIYADPPFCTGRDFGDFNDRWGEYKGSRFVWVEEHHSTQMASFVAYMDRRISQMRRLLKPTGSLYLHCDPTASHYLKITLDRIMGREQYRNEIVWCYTGSNSPTKSFYPRKHDIIFFYAKSANNTFHKQRRPISSWHINRFRHRDSDGRQYYIHSKDSKGSPRKYYIDKCKGMPILSWWSDINIINSQAKERAGYATQKPLRLWSELLKAPPMRATSCLTHFADRGLPF